MCFELGGSGRISLWHWWFQNYLSHEYNHFQLSRAKSEFWSFTQQIWGLVTKLLIQKSNFHLSSPVQENVYSGEIWAETLKLYQRWNIFENLSNFKSPSKIYPVLKFSKIRMQYTSSKVLQVQDRHSMDGSSQEKISDNLHDAPVLTRYTMSPFLCPFTMSPYRKKCYWLIFIPRRSALLECAKCITVKIAANQKRW